MYLLTAVGMAIVVLIESFLGGPTVSTSYYIRQYRGDRKGGGAREWIKTKQIESFITIKE